MSNSLLNKKNSFILLISERIKKMSHGPTNYNKIITNNLLVQQYNKINVKHL